MTSTSLTAADREVLSRLRADLRAASDEHLRARNDRFFKEPVRPYGIKVATVRQIATRTLAGLKPVNIDHVWLLCEDLWRSGWLEESFVACYWSQAMARQFRPTEVEVFGRWLSTRVDNWASCDALCCDSVGRLLQTHPQVAPTVAGWGTSPNRWVRRAAAVSFVVPARRGLHLDMVLAVADILLTDEDDLVRKGYGWMLKAASQAYPDEVFTYLMARRATMPRVAFRYALEKYDQERRDEAMGRTRRQ